MVKKSRRRDVLWSDAFGVISVGLAAVIITAENAAYGERTGICRSGFSSARACCQLLDEAIGSRL
jgi:hypothetical protein